MWSKNACGILLTAIAAALSLSIAGCASSPPPRPASIPAPVVAREPVIHTVVPGDTLFRIAHKYGVSVGQLMATNGISDPRGLRVGQVLTIPGVSAAAPVESASAGVHPYAGERADRQFQWPVTQGIVSAGFGMRNGAMHSGVDISAPAGTPVYAADSGEVIFSGQLSGYGNTVIIRHDDHYVTIYGHNERNLVHEGDRVNRGQQVGEIGSSGRAATTNLHFEVRCDNVARDPLAYLPDPPPAGGVTFAAAAGS